MKTKSRWLLSIITLLFCVATFVGTTFAWFTDSVTSSNNIIASGTLDVEMHWATTLDSTDWKNVETDKTPIFNNKNWEPGYTEVRYIKVKNTGTLAFKYSLAVIPNGRVGALAEVIDVYYVVNPTENLTSASVSALPSVGTLKDIIGTHKGGGVLLPKTEVKAGFYSGEIIVAVAFRLPTSVGNFYQGSSVGDSFSIQIVATQYGYESDSFDPDYDAGAQFPAFGDEKSATAPVTPTADNKVPAGGVSLTNSEDKISATVPEGVLLESGATALTLTVNKLDESNSNVVLDETEVLLPLDVHIDGVSANNTVPMTVLLEEVAPIGLNVGNFKLYHVENGATSVMTAKDSIANLTDHNDFFYDPATGNITLYIASFSEVAVVADTENAWEGNFDYSWYANPVTDENGITTYSIANADHLAAFGAIVGGMDGQTRDAFTGDIVKLIADVNLGDDEENNNSNIIFYPIGYYNSEGTYERTNTAITSGLRNFEGTFDGNGHTIANFYQNTWEMKGDHDWYTPEEQYYRDGMGLFGRVYGGTVKNLTVKNFSSDGEIATTGVISAYAEGATFENIAITNCNPRVYNIGNGGIVGCVGWYAKEAGLTTTFKNITVDNSNKISALWGSWDVACGGIVGQYYPTSGQTSANSPKNAGILFENCHVSAQMDVYNDVCANYQYYAYRYTGMIIGSIRENETIGGHVYPKMDGITAKGCTVNYGTWNNYYYCELVANSIASYTHDHQFSRLTEIKAIEGTTITYLDGTKGTVPTSGRYNYVVVDDTDKDGNVDHSTENATCYHFVDGKVWNHDSAGKETVNGVEVAVEDKQHYFLPFVDQLFTGYGWGVTSRGIENYAGIHNMGITEGDQEESVEKFETKFTGDFLYRVGNQNTVSLGSLFAEIVADSVVDSGVWVSIESVDENSNVSGTFTPNTSDWTQGTIQFTGTGIVKLTIQDYNFCTPSVLYLEVVDAKNTTTASFSGNTVLLQDVSTSSTLGTSGVVYGNGFTVNLENAPISEKNGAVFHLYDGTVLKNLGIVGAEFTSVAMNVNDTNYGVSTVRAWGTVTIENCYISGCRSAVSVTGTELTIKDSVIANGVYANVDFRSGILNLHNVTTINEPHTVNGTTIVGLGIVGNMTASAGRQINISGTLTQYNWLSKADCSNIKASGVSSIFDSVFTDSMYAPLRYTYNGTTYVNTGILSLCSDFVDSNVKGCPSNYGGMDVTATISNVSVDGYVWAPNQAGTLTAEDMKYHDAVYEWKSSNQGSSFIPTAFNFTDADLTSEDGVVQISYESGSSYTLSTDTIKALFIPTKYNQSLTYKVSMDGVDYTNKDIVFDASASQTYTILFTVTDNLIYDKDGKLSTTTYEITKELKIFATVVDKGADAPTFTFYYGTNGSASAGTPHTTQPTNSYASKIIQAGADYYIMPNVSATTANAIGSQTVDGATVYYPIVDGINVRSGSTSDYDFTRYYPIFKAVKISDNGTEYTYSGTKEMPATIVWESATIDSGNGASALNDGFGLYNNQYLCKIQKKAGNEESGGTSVVKYSYTALDGNKYYYYVGYRFYDEDEGCLVEGTLITLADGTQKAVEDITVGDMVMIFNHITGEYEAAPIIFNTHADDNEYREYDVLHLEFANGKEVKIVESHGFFDVTDMQYVYIDYENYENFIGHEFYSLDESGKQGEAVELVSAYITKEVTRIFCPVSYFHMNSFANGFLNTPNIPGDITGLVNYFEYDSDLKYNEEAMQRDIETYGLYSYEDFKDYISEEAYNSSPSVYLKVAVGKGMITYEEIIDVINYLLEGSLIDSDK